MIVQLKDPPSSVLLQRRVKQDTGEEFLLITQVNNVNFTSIAEFDAFFNDINRGGGSPGPLRRVMDSNFVVVPAKVLRDFLEKPEN
ncbi:MAG: hypothetical protein Q8O47_09365 [Candidatus Bathyarchaeota archaeon]|nr:hypothetical protein [Candidatus Bathyarchaeota archaeon]